MGREMSHGPRKTPLSWRIWTIALQFNSGKSFKQFLSSGKIFDIKKLDTNSAKKLPTKPIFFYLCRIVTKMHPAWTKDRTMKENSKNERVSFQLHQN